MKQAKMRFPFGKLVATQGALETWDEVELLALLSRHVRGDWGDLDDLDRMANEKAVADGSRIFSAYETSKGKIWVITEADRSVTTFLLPDEY